MMGRAAHATVALTLIALGLLISVEPGSAQTYYVSVHLQRRHLSDSSR